MDIESFQYIDIHSHIQGNEYDNDREVLLAELTTENIATIAVGVDLASSNDAVTLANSHKNVFAAIGQHPTDTDDTFNDNAFASLSSNERVRAIGECGLDYFRADDITTARVKQMPTFEAQIALASSLKKPLMIHARPSKGSMDAYCDVIEMLKSAKREYGDALTANIHFFVGGVEEAHAFLELDFTVSYTAVLTFTHDYDEVVRYVPLRSILAETDSPYVAPPPNRGKRNTPHAVAEVVRAIACIRNENEEAVRSTMVKNAKRVFSI